MDVNLAVSLVCAVLCAASTDGAWTSVEAETMLLAKLLSTYSRDARPVVMSSQSVNVSVEISFVGLEDIDESKNIFTATILLMQMWKDQRLAWNVSSYGGVKTVRLPVKKLWIPDIVPYNTAGMYEGKHRYDEVGHVLSDGTVFWLPMYTITSRCPMDVSNFPFDKQQCQIILGSWVYSSREVQMTFLNTPTPQVDLSLSDAEAAFPFSSHPNWNVNRAVARLRSVKYSCCEDPFTLLTVTVNLSRTSTFYRWLAVGPAAVYGFLVPLLFLIPSRSDGKTTYGMLLIVGVTLLILTLEQSVPFSHSSVPKIGYFYLGTMALAALSIMLSIFINMVGVSGGRHKPLPAWLKWLCLSRNGFRRIFCISNYIPVDNLYSVSLKSLYTPDVAQSDQTQDNSGQTEPVSDMFEIKRYLQYLVGKQSAGVIYQSVSEEWEEIARVFDRILFILFLALYVLFAVTLLT